MNRKINEKIKKIKDFIKEWREIILLILFVFALIFLMGFKIYSNQKEKKEEINIKQDCHIQAIEKAQEKYRNEITQPSSCKSCKDTGYYRKEDYETYYSECLINPYK